MAEVVLDANILVGWLDEGDALHNRVIGILERLERAGHEVVLTDVLLAEAISVLCRRARERRTDPPSLQVVVDAMRRWFVEGAVRSFAAQTGSLFAEVLDVIEETDGQLNFNDGLLVMLQRRGDIGDVVSLDAGFDVVTGFRRIDA